MMRLHGSMKELGIHSRIVNQYICALQCFSLNMIRTNARTMKFPLVMMNLFLFLTFSCLAETCGNQEDDQAYEFGLLVQNLVKKKLTLGSLKRKIFMLGVHKIDYIKILNINKLTKPYKRGNKYKIFLAYYLGSTRLIDNI